MTKDLKTIDLNLLPIDTLKEMANDTAEQVENNAKATVQKAIDCGRYLTAIKEQLEHGEWLPWLGANWNYSRQMAVKYMRLANVNCGLHLADASSMNEALRMIADDKDEKTAPRAERKQADVVVSTPSETGYRDDSRAATTEAPDDDPTPDPPTQRKTAKGTAKVPEDNKPKTAAIVPEILPDDPASDPWEYMTFGDIIAVAVSKLSDETQQKKAAKHLRKLADKLDPPTKFVKPDLEDVSAYFTELKAVDPESFFDFYESKGWLVGKVSMKDWRASARKWVRENATNGKGNGNGHTSSSRHGGNRGLTADEVFSAESLGRSS